MTFKTSQAWPTEKQGTEVQNANTSAYLEALFQLKQSSKSKRQSLGAFIKVYHSLIVILSQGNTVLAKYYKSKSEDCIISEKQN